MVGLQSSSQHEIMKKMHVFQILNGTDEKSVSNNTPPQATVFWRFEVEKPSKKLIEIQQCYLETFGTIGPQDVSEADVQHFFCHVKKSNA